MLLVKNRRVFALSSKKFLLVTLLVFSLARYIFTRSSILSDTQSLPHNLRNTGTNNSGLYLHTYSKVDISNLKITDFVSFSFIVYISFCPCIRHSLTFKTYVYNNRSLFIFAQPFYPAYKLL